MILNAEDASLGSPMQPVFAVHPFSYLDSDGDCYDIFDLASSLFLFTVRGLDAKLLWRGADGKSSRISFSPPEGIRLNHDRWWNFTLKARVFAKIGIRSSQQFFCKEDQVFIQWEHKFNGSWSSMGAWQAEEAEEVQRSEAEEWTTPASAVYIFSSWESRIAGGCRRNASKW